jgi:SAM-dependent methyltransferase
MMSGLEHGPEGGKLAHVNMRAHPGTARRFDSLASRFDERAGVPPDAAEEVATNVIGRVAKAGVVLEIGSGTGEIGQYLARLARGYVGLDLSAPMLALFRARLTAPASPAPRAVLVRADGDLPWPVRTRSLDAVFASRVAHLLTRDHVISETKRVCRPSGYFVIGRVERKGVKETLRRQRQAMLAERGADAKRSGARRTEDLLNAFMADGGVLEPARTVATWRTSLTPESVIAGWETMPTMAGVVLAPDAKARLLTGLRAWAHTQFGDLANPQSGVERYTLETVRLG